MNNMRNLIWIFFLGAFLISGCNQDDEAVDHAELNILGEWTAEEVSVGATVNGVSMQLWAQDAMQLSDTQAEAFVEEFVYELKSGLTGTITFNEDKTYTLKFGDDPEENGTWLLTGETLTLTEHDSDDDAMELDVITLTETTLTVSIEETESEDMNDDGTADELVITIELTFIK